MSRNLFLLLSVLGLATGCLKPPDYPDEPVIEFLSLSKNTMDQGFLGQDSLKITISFTDGDGDLSALNHPPNLKLTDSRTGESPIVIAIPEVPNSESKYGISGEIEFRIFTECCIPPPSVPISEICQPLPTYPQDTVVYSITLTDRAGNISNEVKTDPIYLRCN